MKILNGGGAFSSLDSVKNLEDYLLYGGSLLDSKKQNFITHALSCLTQRALKSLDTSKWQEFRIGDLFDVVSLKKLNPLDSREFRVKETDKKHPIPAIVAKVGNNGVMYYVGKNDYETAQNKIVIIGDGAVASGLVYYHEKEFTILHNAYAIELKQKEFAKKENYLFLATAIQKSIFEVFNYELKPTWNKVKQECISLPVLPLDSIKEDSRNYTHHIDFAFMESFIKEIQKEHFLSLIEYYHKLVSAYNEVLETNGGGALSFKLEEYLSFYESYKTTQAHNTQLHWQEFRIGDLFKKVSAKFVGKGDKFKAVSKTKDNIYKIPVVYAKFGDNGIMYWAREGDFETHDNIISIVYNGAIAAGKVYAQKEKTGILAESYFIRLKEYKVSFEVNLFLKCALEKSLYERFSRENLATWDNKVENEFISLPVLPNGEIAFEYIESFIKALQKEVIKELVLWNEKELKVAKSLYKNYN